MGIDVMNYEIGVSLYFENSRLRGWKIFNTPLSKVTDQTRENEKVLISISGCPTLQDGIHGKTWGPCVVLNRRPAPTIVLHRLESEATMAQLKTFFPEVSQIRDPKLKEGVLKTWQLALEMGGWHVNDLNHIPFTLLVRTKTTLLEHTRSVTRMAMAVAQQRQDLNMDYVIAGGLLHDVGKLLEYEKQRGKVVKSKSGELVRHPVSGYGLTREANLPIDVSHIVISHSDEGEKVNRTPEAILIHHCDFIDFEIAKRRRSDETIRKRGETALQRKGHSRT
jgi:putative nucleotidyltransferase with HDIG domain